MMIREGERAIRKTEEWVKGTFGVFGERVVDLLDNFVLRKVLPNEYAPVLEEAPPVPEEVNTGLPPIYKVGPVPEELRRDPFPGGSIPWCIREEELEQDRARKMMIWRTAALVSWSVTAITVLRFIGVL